MIKMETVTLNDVYRVAYNSLLQSEVELPCFQKYRENNKKQLSLICKELGINVSDFGDESIKAEESSYNGRAYAIPIILVPLLVAILKSGRRKGSYISLLKSGEHKLITQKQKDDFICIYEEAFNDIKQHLPTSQLPTDEEIRGMIDTLKSKAKQAEAVAMFVDKVDSVILSSIRRDIYNINRVDRYGSLALPNLSWLRDYIRIFVKADDILIPVELSEEGCPNQSVIECSNELCKKRKPCNSKECKKCSWRDLCQRCSVYNECINDGKSNPFFDSMIKEHERKYFTEIYLGMIKNAQDKFYEFLNEYSEVTNDYLSNGHEHNEVSYNEEIVKEHISKTLYEYDAQFERHIDSATLSNLVQEGITNKWT